jgi:iron complex outermembrane receptor protein
MYSKSNRMGYLSSTAFAAMVMGLSCPLSAQTEAAPQTDATSVATPAATAPDTSTATPAITGPDIVVTGSSIRGAPAVGSNLISVGRSAIETNAVQTVQQLLKTVPAIWGGNTPAQGGFSSNDVAGAAVPQIHGLGGANSSSTLVVIDGHRFPLTGIIRNLPDPNILPPNAIERVEVLAEGASSIYGSDAVAGVLNFITRSKFSGLEVNGQYGFGDNYKTYSGELSLGKRWDDGGVAVFYSYSDRSRLPGADRPDYGTDQRARGGANFGNFNCSPATIQPTGQSLIFFAPYSSPGVANSAANANCSQSSYIDLLPSERRHSLLVKMDQEVTDRLTLNGDITFSSRTTTYHEPVTIANGQGTPPATLNLLTAVAYGPGSTKTTQINPFYQDPSGSTATSETIRTDLNGLFPNGARYGALSETFYGHAEAQYKISDDWRVTAFAVVGVNTAKTTMTGAICQACFLLALNGSTNGNGDQTVSAIPGKNVIVTQALTPANAVDVWDPLATNKTSPAVLAQLQDSRSEQEMRQVIQQYDITANGTLFKLPGGDVKLAVGGDMVKYTQQGHVIDNDGTGPSSTGSNFVAVSYARTVTSAFGELLLPIVSENMNIPLMQKLVVNISGRYDHYNEFGNIKNPKYAFSWNVIDGIKFRGNYTTSFVAPQFSTYGPDQLTGIFGKSVDSYFGPQNSQATLDLSLYPEARALPGCTTPGQKTCVIGPGTQANGMTIQGANPNVVPSTGKTWALGADITPHFLPGFRASFTYWHTTIIGAVGAPPIGIVAGSKTFHNLIQIYADGATPAQVLAFQGSRRQQAPLASGPVYFSIDARNQNIYNLWVEGIDGDVSWHHSFDWGSVEAGVNGTYKTRFDQNAGPGEPVFSVLNKNRFNGTFPSNRFDGRANVGATVGPVQATVYANYTGSYTYWGSTALNPVTTTGGIPTGGGDPVKAYTTIDLNVSYDLSHLLGAKIQAYANADNLFNKYPPFVNTSGGYDSFLAFPMGRVVTVGLRAKF